MGTTKRNVTVIVGVANPVAIREDVESYTISKRVISVDSCTRRNLY